MTWYQQVPLNKDGQGSHIRLKKTDITVPKGIIMNFNLISIFRFANKRLISNDLSPLISPTTRTEQFDSLYTYATKGKQHDC